MARDATEDGRERGRLHDALVHDEDVLAARLRHVAVHVEEQGFVVARRPYLPRREDRVHVVADRFRLGEEGIGMEARERAGLDADATAHAFVAEVGAPWPGG